MKNFKERRNCILAAFEQTKCDLQDLNSDIENQISQHETSIADLQAEIKDLKELKSGNNSTISALAKFLH